MIFGKFIMWCSNHHKPVLKCFPESFLLPIYSHSLPSPQPQTTMICALSLWHCHIWVFLIYGLGTCRLMHSVSVTEHDVSEVRCVGASVRASLIPFCLWVVLHSVDGPLCVYCVYPSLANGLWIASSLTMKNNVAGNICIRESFASTSHELILRSGIAGH